MGGGFPAAKALEVLLSTPRAEVAAIFSAGTEKRISALCRDHGLPLHDAARLRDPDAAGMVRAHLPDWLLSANSTVLLPAALLRAPARGALNLHPGLLPEYAGLHTHQWALRNGEAEFGVTVHHMEPAVDTGAIVGQRRFPIRPEDTGLSLFTRCIDEGTKLLREVLETLLDGGELAATPQDLSRRRLYRHRDALDARIDWGWTATAIVDFVRAGNYEPFVSPTYTAALDRAPGFDPPPEVLRAELAEAEGAGLTPGRLAGWKGAHPIVSCAGGAVALSRARQDGMPMDASRWRLYLAALPEAGRLRGRA